MTRLGKIFLINFFCLFFFSLDRLFKEILFFKEKFFFLKMVKNHLFVFFFQGSFFYFLTIALFILLVIFLIRSYQVQDFFYVFSFSLILTGGFNNTLDRLFYGFVIDYFTFFSFFVFNLADIMISGGVILLIFKIFIYKPKFKTFDTEF